MNDASKIKKLLDDLYGRIVVFTRIRTELEKTLEEELKKKNKEALIMMKKVEDILFVYTSLRDLIKLIYQFELDEKNIKEKLLILDQKRKIRTDQTDLDEFKIYFEKLKNDLNKINDRLYEYNLLYEDWSNFSKEIFIILLNEIKEEANIVTNTMRRYGSDNELVNDWLFFLNENKLLKK